MSALVARPTHALILPPCRVCGDKASGIHYGINSCEACKGFFRRSFNRKRKYVCKGENGQCDISPGRNNCAFCRHQRCVHLGMSREGIQLGRHTYKQRMILQSEAQASGNCISSYNDTDGIHIKQEPPDGNDYDVTDTISQYSSHQATGESKSRRTHRRARKQARMDDDNVIKCDENNNGFQNQLHNYSIINQTDVSYPGYNAEMDIYDSLSSPDFFQDSSSSVKIELSDPYSSGCSDTSSIYSTPLAFSGSTPDNYPYYSKQYFIEETKNYETAALPDHQYEFKLQEVLDTLYGDGFGDKSLCSFTPNSCSGVVEDLMNDDKFEGRDMTTSPFSEYDVIVDALVQANHLYNPSEWKFEDKQTLKKKQLEFYDTITMSRVKEDSDQQPGDDSPREGSNSPLRENDLQTDFLFYAKRFELCAVNMIKFAKCIPGFKNLPVVDQEMLIKTAYCEYWLLGSFRTMNPDLEVVTLSTGLCKTLHDFSRYVDETYVREMFSFAGRLQELELSYEEIAVLKAICITFRDRSLLECPDVVEDIQWQLITCFRHMLERRHRNPQQTFTKVIDRLIAMRDITYRDSKERYNLATRWPVIKDFKLLHEIASENF